MIGCLNEETLQAYLDRELDRAMMGQVIKHLAECDWCADDAFEMERAIKLMTCAFDDELPATVPTERLRQRVRSFVTGAPIAPDAVIHLSSHIEGASAKKWKRPPLSSRRIAYAAAAALVLTGLLWLGMSNWFFSNKETHSVRRPEQTDPRNQPAPLPKRLDNDQTGGELTAGSKRKTGSASVARREEKKRQLTGRDESPGPDDKDLIAEWHADEGDFLGDESTTFHPGMIRHFERAQVLLRYFRNSDESVGERGFDLARERRQSKSLLYENILLRRDAEISGNLPAEEVLGSLEPILLDISNLPDEPSRDEVRTIKERMQRQEIIGMLQVYSAEPMATK